MAEPLAPTEINLHQKSRLLEIAFTNGKRYQLPCEYLRVFSKAAEVQAMGTPESGKEDVNIRKIEQQGSYALRLFFDDGHSTGIYSWETLYQLGENFERNWQDYLEALKAIGYQRQSPEPGAASNIKARVTLLYFGNLPDILGNTAEEVELPQQVKEVGGLLEWLRTRGDQWATLLANERVTVTVNKQFAESFTRLSHQDEIAIVPKPV